MRRPPRDQNGAAGFSLIQLVVVVGVLAVVMAVLSPSIHQASDSYVLRRAASATMAELRRAQTAATAEGADYTVEFFTSPASGNPGGVLVWRQDAATPERSVLPPAWALRVEMDDVSTTFPVCTAPADPAHKCVTYRPLGYPTEGGRVRLRMEGSGITLDVVVTSATGRVSIER